MTYIGASATAQSRESLGVVLESLQRDPNIPSDVLAVTENIARAVGALFEAERASSDVDGKASVRHAMGSLSQTMALLQDVKTRSRRHRAGHEDPGRGDEQALSAGAGAHRQAFAGQPAEPARLHAGRRARVPPEAARHLSSVPPGTRELLEANVGATTESNFFVGFSGDIAEGGVFVATYSTADLGSKVDVLVTLPGGFEKKIPGTVRFVRDPMDMDSEPGIGVRFDRLDDEARELILRFIRKRPPLFYDE